MRRARGCGGALAVAMLAACSFSGGGSAFTQRDARLPDPVDPVDAVPDAPDGAPMVDTDGDGRDDDVDNCLMIANADQHDEDGDLQGDLCDACPAFKDQGTNNADGDALPDACDPHPSLTGDTLEEFFAFATAGAGLPAGWTLAAGDLGRWSVVGDSLQLAAVDATDIATYNVGVAKQVLEIGFDALDHTIPSGQLAFFDGLVNVNAASSQYVACGFRLDGTPLRELFDYDNARATSMEFVNLDLVTTDPPSTPGSYRLTMVSEAATQTCYSTGTADQVHELAGVVTRRNNQHIGLRGRNVTIKIRYVAVYHYL